MQYRTKIALGCGGFLILAVTAAVIGVLTTSISTDPAQVRARSFSIVALEPDAPLAPFFARRLEGDGDEAAIWAVDSRYQNLMLVLRSAQREPSSPEELIAGLAQVHPVLTGFEPEPGAQRETIRILGQERLAIVQSAQTVDEARQSRACVAFPYDGRWVLAMLQGDPVDASAAALERILARVQAAE